MGVVCREYSKGPKTLPCGVLNSIRTGCDLESEATAVRKQLARNDDKDERADGEISNQCFKR